MPAVINIEGPITDATPALIRAGLDADPVGDVKVNVNSLGGNAFAGFAAYNLLKQSGRPVVVHVLGVAASAASPILAAAKRVTAAKNAQIMIHEPSIQTNGDASDHTNNAKLLSGLRDSFVESLAAKMNWPADKISAAMKATTWFTATEAHAAGLVDEIIDTAATPLACSDLAFDVPVAAASLIKPVASSMAAEVAAHKAKITAMNADHAKAVATLKQAHEVAMLGRVLRIQTLEAELASLPAPKAQAASASGLEAFFMPRRVPIAQATTAKPAQPSPGDEIAKLKASHAAEVASLTKRIAALEGGSPSNHFDEDDMPLEVAAALFRIVR